MSVCFVAGSDKNDKNRWKKRGEADMFLLPEKDRKKNEQIFFINKMTCDCGVLESCNFRRYIFHA